MSGDSQQDRFNKDRAELFEALGHPTRIKILELLAGGSLGFSGLKKVLDIESSGLLQFHLGKLQSLVKATPEGSYALTDDGKEALRNVIVCAGSGNNHLANKNKQPKTKILTIALVLTLFISAGLVVYAYYTTSQVGVLLEASYNEYKYQYVWHVWRNLNYAEWRLHLNDTQQALYSMDSALKNFRQGGWVRFVMVSYSTDYKDLENDPNFVDDVNKVYENLMAIREHIFYNTVTDSDLAFLKGAENAYQIWSDNLVEPTGGVYKITNLDAIKSSFQNLTLLII